MAKKADGFVNVSLEKRSFKRVRNFVSVFRTQVDQVVDEEMEESANSLADLVKSVLLRQAYTWKPLSERYLAWKKREGLDLRTLIATKTYVQSIRAVPRKRKGEIVSWGVGPGHPNEKHGPSGLRLHDLARLLEYGTRRMPARPHWRPAWSAFVRRDRKLLARNIIKRATKV